MTEEKTTQVMEEKMNEEKLETKVEDNSQSVEPVVEKKKKTTKEKTEKVNEPKKVVKPKVKKYEAIAHSYSMHASKKHVMYISDFIKNKKIDEAISMLESVIKLKRAVPFKGEIPHRKGMGSGRYPVNASKEMIYVLKGLKGNALVNGLDLDKTRIFSSSASWATRPARSGGRKAKRINLIITAREIGVKKNG